jgi:hypothetical protein
MDLKNDKDYYSDKSMVSNSMLGRLLENEVLFSLWQQGLYEYEPTEPMAVGNVIHANYFSFLSGEPVDESTSQRIHIVDDYDLRTKVGKEYFSTVVEKIPKGDMFLKKSVNEFALAIVESMKSDEMLNGYFENVRKNYLLRFEVPFTSTFRGIPVKGKADIVCVDPMTGDVKKIIDLKTTSSIGGFKGSVRKYGYNRQYAFYTALAGLDMRDADIFDFVVVEKQTSRSRVFTTNRKAFKDESVNALNYALDKYQLWASGNVIDFKTEEL